MAHGLKDFNGGKSVSQAIFLLFWAQMALILLVGAGPKKVAIFSAHPSNGPWNGFGLRADIFKRVWGPGIDSKE
jgi:hypothetical protein